MTRISVDDVYGYLCSKEDYLILDLRKVSDYQTGHIVGAVSADMDKAVNGDYEDGKATMKKVLEVETGRENGNGKVLVLACYTGNRYAQAATNVLSMIGADMEQVYTLEGGNNAWNKSRYSSLTTTEEGAGVLSLICLFASEDEPLEKKAESKPILLEQFDFSSRVGNSSLNLEDVSDLFSIRTPCAFEQASYDSGYEPEVVEDHLALDYPKTGDRSIKLTDRMIEVHFKNGAIATLSQRWPEGQGIDEPKAGNASLRYSVYNEKLLVVVYRKTDDIYRASFMEKAKEEYPILQDFSSSWNGEEGAVSFRGENRNGQVLTVVFSSTFSGLCVENR